MEPAFSNTKVTFLVVMVMVIVMIITVNGPLCKASRLSEDASDRGHTIRLFVSLVDSLTDLNHYYNELAKGDEKSLRKACDQLCRLIVHQKAEYDHGLGVVLDVIEKRNLSP